MILTNDQTQVCPGLDKQKTLCDQQINVCHARARSNPTSILSPSAASLQELEFGSLKHFRMISQMRSSGDDPVRMGSETLQDSQSDSGRSVIPGRVCVCLCVCARSAAATRAPSKLLSLDLWSDTRQLRMFLSLSERFLIIVDPFTVGGRSAGAPALDPAAT
ncbi:hypothetical protein RRG08_043532 [Elysia crispata]|uniref:Uncharacterized protein n=1 Tax=Elysia crispata TaxID=231223 RepID=A0AAE0YGF2_9GAST|nr:hypothetical protein RRG08_043532 [Elysia crispata]